MPTSHPEPPESVIIRTHAAAYLRPYLTLQYKVTAAVRQEGAGVEPVLGYIPIWVENHLLRNPRKYGKAF
jgi:hypothetical protein